MTDPDPIVAFLTARLDDEQRASEAAEALNASPWSHRDGVVVGSTYDRETDYDLWDVEGTDFGRLHMHGPVASHVAMHDPRRVLADVEAKRAILRHHRRADDRADDGTATDIEVGNIRPGACLTCLSSVESQSSWPSPDFPCRTVLLLAQVYADHADFDPSWAS